MNALLPPDPWRFRHTVTLAATASGLELLGFIMGARAVPPCALQSAASAKASAA